MRLLYLQPSSTFGGAERQASIAVPLLTKLGFDVTTMVGPSTSGLDWLREYGVDDLVHTPDFPGGWRKPRGFERLALPGRYLRCVRRVAAQVHRVAVERGATSSSRRWRFRGSPRRRSHGSSGFRSSGARAGPKGDFSNGWRCVPGRRSIPPDLLICCGEDVRRMFAPLIPAPSVVVPNGVDIERFDPRTAAPAWFRPPGAKVVIGFGARLAPQKRPEDVIRAAALLAPAYPEAAFVIAGEGSRRAEYEALARSLGVANAVRFVGYVPDMRSFYASVDIVVLPSRSEGCPNVVLESMAMRRALVVSDSAGSREVVTNGVNGLMFPVGDVGALANQLRRLLDDPVLRTTLARRGYERASAASAPRPARPAWPASSPSAHPWIGSRRSVIAVPPLKEAART